MRLSMLRGGALAAALSLCTACGDDGGLVPTTVLLPATVVFYGDTAAVTVPDSVRAWVPFVVTMQSFGGGCIVQDQTGVVVTGNRADVRPLVREPHPASQTPCTADLRILTHSAPVTFTQPGAATVVIHGRARPGETAQQFTRTVRVVP
jgi:hypothetical protein